MVSHVNSLTFQGIEVVDVDVQAHVVSGIPAFTVVGLPDKTIAESKERVRAALNSMGLSLPPKRITINLSPADLNKEGSHFDLAIAVALLLDMGILPKDELENYLILGELSLDGSLTSGSGILPASIGAVARGKGIVCPAQNGREAAWSGCDSILAPTDLLSLINHFKGNQFLSQPTVDGEIGTDSNHPDMKDVIGQDTARRALEVTAAGGHNMLMCGPPGAGKSMLASRIPGILPSMSAEEMLECSMVASVAGYISDGKLSRARPFRAPHHSCSMPAMVGGGMARKVVPGEISLAHNGVLFLDELPEFPRAVLDSLRQPLEERVVRISRSGAHITFPANFQLIAAMNPCRCGYLSDPERSCNKAPRCATDYQSKISGPLMDRIDIYIDVPNVNPTTIQEHNGTQEGSQTIARRVELARGLQRDRYEGYGINTNSELDGELLIEVAYPDYEGKKILNDAAEKMKLSMRGYNRILKVARTIADLGGSKNVRKIHIAEAVNYRYLTHKNVPVYA